jgi:hypothetical protein
MVLSETERLWLGSNTKLFSTDCLDNLLIFWAPRHKPSRRGSISADDIGGGLAF